MTDELNLDELERLERAATPGPWTSHRPGRYGEVLATESEWTNGYYGFLVAQSCGPLNAEFIVAARNALPALIRRIRELEQNLADARNELEMRE